MIRLNDYGEFVADTKVIVLAPGSKQEGVRGSIVRHIRRAGNQLFYSITGQSGLIPAERVREDNAPQGRAGDRRQ